MMAQAFATPGLLGVWLRCVRYGAQVGAAVGAAIGLPFFVFGALISGPIGCVYGAALGLLNVPGMVFAVERWGTGRSARVAGAITSGIGGAITVLVLNSQRQYVVLAVVTLTWAGIGWLVGPRAAFGKPPKTADLTAP